MIKPLCELRKVKKDTDADYFNKYDSINQYLLRYQTSSLTFTKVEEKEKYFDSKLKLIEIRFIEYLNLRINFLSFCCLLEAVLLRISEEMLTLSIETLQKANNIFLEN